MPCAADHGVSPEVPFTRNNVLQMGLVAHLRFAAAVSQFVFKLPIHAFVGCQKMNNSAAIPAFWHRVLGGEVGRFSLRDRAGASDV